MRNIALGMLTNPEYVAALNARLQKGAASTVEPLLWHYAYGKPVETSRLEGPGGGPLSLKVVHEHHD